MPIPYPTNGNWGGNVPLILTINDSFAEKILKCDSNGKRKKCSDSARYKALGNSIALPYWFWLLRRISAQYERPATLGSLFDGIGGFVLCWERCNGSGTARWASEIEEFPIAVTSYWFEEGNEKWKP